MRKYKLVVSRKGQTYTEVTTGSSTHGTDQAKTGLLYSSFDDKGNDNPAALDIVFDITVAGADLAMPGSYVEVFGVSIDTVKTIRKYQGGVLSLYAGFSKGFPLAKPDQYGLIARGTIVQAYGNWTGTSQSVVFMLMAAGVDGEVPFVWNEGAKLSTAIKSALKLSYGRYTFINKLSADPVATVDEASHSENIFTFGEYLKRMTLGMGYAKAYGGISITAIGDSIYVYDAPQSAKPINIDFNDMQGQPVYFGYAGNSTTQVMLNMRKDFTVFSEYTFPTQVSAGYSFISPANTVTLTKDSSLIKGTYVANSVRHFGHFRDPRGESWVTIVNGVPKGG